jgi:hypothetical protein
MTANPIITPNDSRLLGPTDRFRIDVDAPARIWEAGGAAQGRSASRRSLGFGRARIFAKTRIVWAGTMTRMRRPTLTFKRPFTLKGVERQLPAGEYELVTDEELIEELSFLA